MSYLFSDGLEGNIWKYGLLLIANKRIYIAILGAYYLTIPGITAWWIGVILLVSNIAGFLIEIPSGFIADKVGHKKALVFARICTLLSTVFFLIAQDISHLLFAGVFMSVGNAFHSGTGSAFMHETLRALGRSKDYRGVMGRLGSIGFGVPIVLTTAIPFLVDISWKLPFLVSLVMDAVGLLAAISLLVPPVNQEHIKEITTTNFLQVMREGHRLRYFRYAVFSGLLGGTIMGVSGFRAVYQDVLQIPVVWYGVLFAIGRAMAALLLWKTEWIQKMIGGRPTVYVWKLGIFLVPLSVLGYADSPWVVALIFILINGFQWGLTQVGYSIEAISASKFKATLLSVKSQVSTLIFGLSSVFLGFMIEHWSYRVGFAAVTVALVIASIPLLAFIHRDAKRRKPRSDGDMDGDDA